MPKKSPKTNRRNSTSSSSKARPSSSTASSPRRRSGTVPDRPKAKRKRSASDTGPVRVSPRLSGKSTRKLRARRKKSDADFGSPASSAAVSKWSAKQIAALSDAVAKSGVDAPNWKRICRTVRGKSAQECQAYWTEHLKAKGRRRQKRRKKAGEVSAKDGQEADGTKAGADPLWNQFVKPIVAELTKARLPQALLAAYEGDGWKRSNHEKVRPEKELQGARQRILKIKEKIRGLLLELADGEEAKKEIPVKNSSDDSEIDADDILCAICRQGDDEGEENDIVLCDLEGCNKAFHQKCLQPHITREELDQSDDWFCRRCNCKLNCLNAINDEFETDYDDVHQVFKSDLEEASKPAASGGRGAWDTHSFSSNTDSEYETQENGDQGSEDDDDDTQSESGEEETLVLNYKRARKRVDYVKLARELDDELADDSGDADFSMANSKLDENATLKSAFA